MNWSDLKYLIEFKRTGSLAAVARRLDVDATTVSRRVRLLDAALGLEMLERGADGNLVLTAAGIKAAAKAEQIEQLVRELQSDLAETTHRVDGTVRVSAVPMLVNRLLVRKVNVFSACYPDLNLHLNSENRNISLSNRETDIALRLGRPVDGGHHLKARRIGRMDHAVFAPKDMTQAAADLLPWLGYQDMMQHLPQAKWMEDNVAGLGGHFAPARVSDADGALESVAAGLGKTVLPCLIAQGDPRLQAITKPLPDLYREVWLIHRAEDAKLARIQAVCDWLVDLFQDSRAV
ncbi:LysR family transcriptional regulator [Roseibium algae]|uniref:LysR family transcriptional regulator n=1 Tax=Roseibium algae TaxID=3123038 RepID=A0ABU8TH10_9HYPH